MKNINVLLVEDDPVWMQLMSSFLMNNNDIELIQARCFSDALKAVSENKIDVVLMDINLTENLTDGISLCAEITKNNNLKVIMLTSLDPKDAAVNSYSAGATAYVSKNEYKKIPEIIRNTIKDNAPMELLLDDYRRLKKLEVMNRLSKTEIQILELLERGYNRKKIQKLLVKSESTLKNQISSILKKLEVSDTKEAISKVSLRS